jgi:hypothetical protein
MHESFSRKYLKRINWAKGDDRRDRKNPMAAFHYSMVHDRPGSRQPGLKGRLRLAFQHMPAKG